MPKRLDGFLPGGVCTQIGCAREASTEECCLYHLAKLKMFDSDTGWRYSSKTKRMMPVTRCQTFSTAMER